MASRFSLIKPLAGGFTVNSKVIKASEYQRLCVAEDLIAAAEGSATLLLAEADREAKRAIEAGYRDGARKGKEEVARKMITARLRASEMMEMAEADLVELLKMSVDKVFEGLDEDRRMVGLIRSGLHALRNDYRVIIRVPPPQVESVKSALSEVAINGSVTEYFEVKGDSTLSTDTCVLEGDGGVVSCSLSDQLTQLKALIGEGLG